MRPSRALIFLGIGVLSAAIALALYAGRTEFLTAIDLKLRDVRLRLRGDLRPPENVVIAAIDSKSINELGRWPWDRRVTAKLIERLSLYGAKTTALDIVFSEPSQSQEDMALAKAIRKSGNVVAGYFFRHEEEAVAEPELIQLSKIKVLRIGEGVTGVPFESYPYVEMNIPPVAGAASSAGFFNIVPDGDGIVRQAVQVMLYDGDVYPSLPLAALRHYMGAEPVLDIAPYGAERLLIGDTLIPVDESGRLTLNYYGKGGAFRTVPAVDVIKGRLLPGALDGALVFVGPSEIGIADLRPTPLDPVSPGVEIHATVAANVIGKRFLIRDGRVLMLEILFIALFPLALTSALSLFRKTLTALALFAVTLGLYTGLNFLLFNKFLLNTSVVFPFISISLSYLGSEAYRNFVEERQSRFLKKAFSSYVSPELVGEIIKDPDKLKLGGEKRLITVLFSDIRGFTTISERLAPENLVLLLNQYLGPMTDVILSRKGTLDKYIGDAIMAIFNAPLLIKDHPALACSTALDMSKKLKGLNEGFRAKGFPEINIGIGINTGDAIVGNMGTDIRFDFTAIGDTVNLASRLEGLCKLYGTRTIVSESTVSALPPDVFPGLRELDLIKVKGKDKPVVIYELLEEIDPALRERFASALRLYREGRFKEAREIFNALGDEYKDNPSRMFASRCDEIKQAPPDWAGVYEAKAK